MAITAWWRGTQRTQRVVRQRAGARRGLGAHLGGLAAFALMLVMGLVALPTPAQAARLLMPSVGAQSVVNGAPHALASNGASTGGDGSGQAMQQVRFAYEGADCDGKVAYSVYQDGAWLGERSDGAFAGALDRPIQAVKLRLEGEAALYYDLFYRAAAVGEGWLGWAKANEVAGAPGLLPLEAVQVQLVAKGDMPPSSTKACVVEGVSLQFDGYVSDQGWDGPKSSGDGAGVGGKALHSFKAHLVGGEHRLKGSICYRVFAGEGWREWAQDDQEACAVEPDVPIQALQAQLTGSAASAYDLYYRVYSERYGWMGLAKNGQSAGAAHVGSVAQAVQLWLVPKGSAAPVPDPPSTESKPYDETVADLQFTVYRSDTGEQPYAHSGEGLGTAGVTLHDIKICLAGEHRMEGSVAYRVFAGGAWKDWVSNGASASPVDASAPITALEVKLEGAIANFADVYYRVFSERYGWMGLAKNGQSAGTARLGSVAHAVQVWLVPKWSLAPDSEPTSSESRSFVERFTSGDAELDAIVDTVINRVTGQGEDALRRAFNYVASFPYVSMSKYPQGDWSPAFAKQMYWNSGGNCYRYAALFREIARGLGYKARVVSGEVPTNFDAHAAHGWVEIEIDGTLYIFDPDLSHEYPGHNFYQRTYDKPPINYTIYERGPW